MLDINIPHVHTTRLDNYLMNLIKYGTAFCTTRALRVQISAFESGPGEHRRHVSGGGERLGGDKSI